MSTWSRKLNRLFKENAQLIIGWRTHGRREIGNKEMLILLSLKPVENLNLSDWTSFRRLNGQIRLKEKRSICVENWIRETKSFKNIAQEIAKKSRNYEESVAKKQIETSEN